MITAITLAKDPCAVASGYMKKFEDAQA
jgi:hypothetical protein